MKILLYISVLFISLTSFTCSKDRVVLSEDKITNDIFYMEGEIKPFTGICIIPFDDGKTVKEVRRFKEGIVDGEAISYYSDGTLRRRGEYNSGKMNGLWQQWTESGQLSFQAVYSNDSMSGCFKEWYENGQIKEEGQYFNNVRYGKWKFYNQAGEVVYEKQYAVSDQKTNRLHQTPCI